MQLPLIDTSVMNYNFIVKIGRKCKIPSLYFHVRTAATGYWATILAYHRIDDPARWPWAMPPVSPKDFEREMKLLKNKYETISLSNLVGYIREGLPFRNNLAVVTLDDGFRDNYLYAHPILAKYDIPATIFLATSRIGNRTLAWSDQINYACWHSPLDKIEMHGVGCFELAGAESRRRLAACMKSLIRAMPLDGRENAFVEFMNVLRVRLPERLGAEFMLSWDDVKEMRSNRISFGAHTVSHPKLTELDVALVEREICLSKRTIEEELDEPVSAFAYPYGSRSDYNTYIMTLVEKAGFECAVTLDHGIVGPLKGNVGLFELPRISASRLERFEWDLSGLTSDLLRLTKPRRN